jgi:hypothetical protein
MRHRFLRALVPALALAALPAISSAGVFIGVSVGIAPPPLPVYEQPPCPEPGYIWTPGYWAWNDGAYYWVPGTWVLPPQVGLLWTPGYWGWDDGAYVWHAGYWAPHVGFYGGVDYGFGYDGVGFIGGYWRGSTFFYNRAVVHVGPTFVRNVYYHPVTYHTTYEHVSFSGGPGGVRARETREQMVAEHERHVAFTSMQERQQRMAFADHSLRADYNHGRPPVAATVRPAVFHGSGAFAARAAGGPVHFTPTRSAAPMRSDRPSWASGQNRDHASPAAPHSMEHGTPSQRSPHFPGPEQQRFQGPGQQHFQQPEPQHLQRPEPQHFQSPGQQRFERPEQQHFQVRPQGDSFQARGGHPMERPQERSQARPEPQFHQSLRPQERGPAPRGPAAAPHPQQHGGGDRPHRPPEGRGHNR